MLNYKKTVSFGFTLIELMVVIAIIGILFIAGIVAFTKSQQGGRDARRLNDIDGISQALEAYKSLNGSYPVFSSYAAMNLGSPYFTSGPPQDPQNFHPYVYTYYGTADAFCVCDAVENVSKANSTSWAGSSGTPVCAFGTPANGAQGYFCSQGKQ